MDWGKALRWVSGAGALAALGVTGLLMAPEAEPSPRQSDFERYRAGPTSSRSVYWVGHSLMNARDSHLDGSKNVIELMEDFADAKGLEYRGFDHTLFGAPLSLLWTGSPVAYDRQEPEMLERRAELLEHGESYDTLVMTEGIPVGLAADREHSAYFAQAFYCALIEQNPRARVYLYETWVHFEAGDRTLGYPPPDRFDFAEWMREDRPRWEHIADLASTGRVPEPGLGPRFRRLLGGSARMCNPKTPIFIVPVGTAMLALMERLEQEPRWHYRGAPLAMHHYFTNPHVEWPAGWPREGDEEIDVDAALAELPKAYPGEEVDEVHPSDFGVYFTGLVHFATLYRQSPVGLPPAEGMPEETARGLQELVWDVVRHDSRTGVAASP